MKELQRVRLNMYIQTALWIVLGLALFILQDDGADFYCIVLGIVLLIQGLPQLVLFVIERTRYMYSFIMLLSGFLTSILGVISITMEHVALPYLPMIIGLAVLIHGGKETLMLYYIKHKMFKNWKLLAALDFITVIVGIALIALTWMTQDVDLRPTGIVMIVDAIIECAILYIGDTRDDIPEEAKYYARIR